MNGMYSRILHLGSGIAGEGSEDKLEQTVLDAAPSRRINTLCSLSKTDFKTESLTQKMTKNAQFFWKKLKNNLNIGGTALNLRWKPSTVGPAHRSPSSFHINYYKLSQHAFLPLSWGLESLFSG